MVDYYYKKKTIWKLGRPHLETWSANNFEHMLQPGHTAKDPRFWQAEKPHSDTLARLYGLVRGYPEVIGSQLPVIRAQ